MLYGERCNDADHNKMLNKKMKKLINAIALASMILTAPAAMASSTPDITDLLKSAAEKAKGGSNGNNSSALSGLKGVVDGLMTSSNVGEDDLVGNWQYSAPAVVFKSDNVLQKAGGSAASGIIVDKIAPYYEKVGITSLTATFNQDRTFELKLKRITLTGTYALAGEEANGDFVFNFKAVKKLPLGKMNAHVEKVGSKITLTFDASKLITLVNTVAKVSGKASLQSVAKLLNSYEGLNCGFELSPVK